MNVFEEALSKTNNLMETMDNFNSHKIQDKNIFNDEQEKNNNNSIKPRKLHKLKTYNQKKFNKFQLKPIKNNIKLREPYNYQKEYENNLINQIEQLFNPNYTNNNSKDNVGMLSFLSPLINSNLDKRNKEFYNKILNLLESFFFCILIIHRYLSRLYFTKRFLYSFFTLKHISPT